MPVQDFINRYAMATAYTNKLSGLAFKPQSGLSATSGTVDWYTCPTGKRAAVMSFSYCLASGSGTITPMLKSGGIYYNLNSALTASTIGTSGLVNLLVLDANESFSTNQSSATINVWVSIMEYDSDISLKTIKLLSLVNGNNTIYTCPAGKSAIFMGSNICPCDATATLPRVVNYWNNSGGTRNIQVYHVPSGGAASSSNLILPNGPQAVTTGSFLTNQIAQNCMNVGDFIVINTDAATATQFTWVTVLEK